MAYASFMVAISWAPAARPSSNFRSLWPGLKTGIALTGAFEMFFGEISHAEILQPGAEHPVIERTLGRRLIGLLFVSLRTLDLAE